MKPSLSILILLVLSLLLTACAELIVIERVKTPAPETPLQTPAPLNSPEPASSVAVFREAPSSTVIAAVSKTASPPERIIAKAINLDAPVVAMDWRADNGISVWNVPENEAGWHINSARPGEGSNVVISGHNNSQGGRVFGQLEDLSEGDVITVWTKTGAYTYRVVQKQIVRTFAASAETLDYLRRVTAPSAQEQLTLITCWPNWSNTHRLIVIASLVSSLEKFDINPGRG